MSDKLIIEPEGKWTTVVQVTTPSLMDQAEIKDIADTLHTILENRERRFLVIDFSTVQFISSQAIGALVSLHKKAVEVHGLLVLCGVNAKLAQLLKITRLDSLLTVVPTQSDAVAHIGKVRAALV